MAVVAVAATLYDDNKTMTYFHNKEWRKMKVVKRLFGKVATVRDIPTNLTCYSRVAGIKPLGEIPKSKCKVIYKENDINPVIRERCYRCVYHGILGPVLRPSQALVAFQYLISHEAIRSACDAACVTVHVPDEDGTGVVENSYWLCGYAVYVSLPRQWTGTCALIQLHGGAMVIQHQPHATMRRKKRGLLNIVKESPVPKNHHIWNIAEKLLAFFVPGIGVASVMQEVQVTRYELISFITTTKIMMEGIKEELRGLRFTALQNRLVLDHLTASQGGVCVIVGETCCTYIPDNDAKGYIIEEGIKNLSLMAKNLTDWETNTSSFGWGWGLGWFKGIFTNVTNVVMMRISIVCSVLLILCLWPCIMKLIRNAVSSTFQHQTHHYDLPSLNQRPPCVPKPVEYDTVYISSNSSSQGSFETDPRYSSSEDDTET